MANKKIPAEVWQLLAAAAFKGIDVLKERVQKRGFIIKFRSNTDERLSELEKQAVQQAETSKKILEALAADAAGDESLIAQVVESVKVPREGGEAPEA